MYGFLADLTVALHVCYAGFVVLGQVAIWLGWVMKWGWTRNFWFRALHLLAIGYVAFEEFADLRCPLSLWEEHLRVLAGQPVTGETFLGRMLHAMLFYDFEPWVFTTIHLACAAAVGLTFVLYPPRWPVGKSAGRKQGVGNPMGGRTAPSV